MNEVKITYETLFDLLRREKDREDLQELDNTFYSDVLTYLAQKLSILNEHFSEADMFGQSEHEKTKVQIMNIKKIIKDLYERRQMKIIRMAVNTSKVNSSLAHTQAMLPEELRLYEEVLSVFKNNRELVLNNILYYGNGGSVSHSRPKPMSASDAVGMPSFSSASDNAVVREESAEMADADDASENASVVEDSVESSSKSASAIQSDAEVSDVDSKDANAASISLKNAYNLKVGVRFKSAVPKFKGKEQEEYGPFSAGDEAEMPKLIADILVKKGRAEEI